MLVKPNVNQQIFNHFKFGGGAAGYMRELFFIRVKHSRALKELINKKSYIDRLVGFFETTDDFSRLVKAKEFVELILLISNGDYLLPLWEHVRKLEVQRKIKYLRQTDHTVHSLYLYLMGIWIFDHSTAFRETFSRKYSIKKRDDLYPEFLGFWLYSSLFHDIGYVFWANDSNSKRETLALLNRYYQVEGLKIRFPYVPDETLYELWGKVSPKIADWKEKKSFPVFDESKDQKNIIKELNKIPWMKDLFPYEPKTIFSFFNSLYRQSKRKLWPDGKFLKTYAEHVATKGYSHNEEKGYVDHGIASGLLLFQLSSFNYWLYSQSGNGAEFEEREYQGSSLMMPLSFEKENLKTTIAPGCHAAASHNIIKSVPRTDNVLPFRLDKNPLLFFSVMCDEIQQWHRAPIGDSFTGDLSSYLAPQPDEIGFSIITEGSRDTFILEIENEKIKNKIQKALVNNGDTKIDGRLNAKDLEKLILFRDNHGGYISLT